MADALTTWDTLIAAQAHKNFLMDVGAVARCGTEEALQIGVQHLYKQVSGFDFNIDGADPDIFWTLMLTLLLTARKQGRDDQ